MLKTFSVAILAIAMSVGVAQAKGHMHKQMMMSACIDGQQASATCACGTAARAGLKNLNRGICGVSA